MRRNLQNWAATAWLVLACLGIAACGASAWADPPLPAAPTLPGTPFPAIPRPASRPSPLPDTPAPTLVLPEPPGTNGHPTLADFWQGQAIFVVEVVDTGLPMGESDTIVMGNGELWSYVHASQRSAGTIDRCGDPVSFPGCTVIYRSDDGGYHFRHDDPPTCQFACRRCPCDSQIDHVDQQQYPRVAFDGRTLALAYEYQGRVMVRRSHDGLAWSAPEHLPGTGIWHLWYSFCGGVERIYDHPFAPADYQCLVGGPPGVYADGDTLFVFVALGQNPGAMGCYQGPMDGPISTFRRCQAGTLFVGSPDYGPPDLAGLQANPYFDFRTISSAAVQQVGDRYYMLYEGVRGPGPFDPGDTQFGLGLARSQADYIDGLWETYPGNPILVDLPGNIGLGHADLVVLDGQTLLYTSLNGTTRSRLALVWQ